MATQIGAPTHPLTRPAPHLRTVALAILAVVAIAVIGAVAWTQADSSRDTASRSQAYGVGYPLHGGLAGPGRIGADPQAAGPSRSYGAGYPLHGGLAGPSRAGLDD